MRGSGGLSRIERYAVRGRAERGRAPPPAPLVAQGLTRAPAFPHRARWDIGVAGSISWPIGVHERDPLSLSGRCDTLSPMLGPLFRLATLSFLTLLCGCEFRRGGQEAFVAAPTPKEEEVLNLVLANMGDIDHSSCLERVVRPESNLFWPSALFFGDGKLTYAGDARFDEIAALQSQAKPLRSVALHLPALATRRGFRVVENASSVPSCRARIALHPPLFDGNFAVVTSDVQLMDKPGGDAQIQVLRFHDGHWQNYASGVSSWGRPVI